MVPASSIWPTAIVKQSIQQLCLRHSQAAAGADRETSDGLISPEPFQKRNLRSLHFTDCKHEAVPYVSHSLELPGPYGHLLL